MDFETVVKTIEESNRKVDEVLKAARLERNEKQSNRVEMVKAVLDRVVGIVAIVAVSVLLGLVLMR